MTAIGIRPAAKSLALAAALLVIGSAPLHAQTANIAGEWLLSVMTDQGTTSPTMVLEQDGETLSGRYTSETLGTPSVTGTVDGNKVTINMTANLQGQDIPVTYEATVQGDGTLSGTIDIAGGMMSGTFTARKKTE